MSKEIYKIRSAQVGLHPLLRKTALRHHKVVYQKPVPALQSNIFHEVMSLVSGPVILDLGCGTGLSTVKLAELHPDCCVIGVDQSLCRLNRNNAYRQRCFEYFSMDGNKILVRAEIVAFMQLLVAESIMVEKIYLLYPNPWPKIAHYKRRWHGHPIFSAFISQAKSVECRTNWKIYAEEMEAVATLLQSDCTIYDLNLSDPITLFEQKYMSCGVPIYQLVITST